MHWQTPWTRRKSSDAVVRKLKVCVVQISSWPQAYWIPCNPPSELSNAWFEDMSSGRRTGGALSTIQIKRNIARKPSMRLEEAALMFFLLSMIPSPSRRHCMQSRIRD